MMAVTIISPAYRKVGAEAIRRMERFSGLKVKVLECSDADGFKTKLSLDKLAGKGPRVFFDADLWSLRQWDGPSLASSPCFMAVHDHAVWNCHTFCHHDSHKHGLDPLRYFNSGFFFWRNDDPLHREVFKLARQSWKDQQAGRKHYDDKTDQAHLNFGMLQSGAPLQWLPMQYNTYCFGIRHGQFTHYPRDIINLHGAGIKAERKFSRLKIEASVFGQKIFPMHQQAINFEHERAHLLR